MFLVLSFADVFFTLFPFALQWVADGSPSKSTPIKVESPNQFVPMGTTKKEFKKIQAAVRIHDLIRQIKKCTSCRLDWCFYGRFKELFLVLIWTVEALIPLQSILLAYSHFKKKEH